MNELYKKLRDEFFVEMLKRKSGKINEKKERKRINKGLKINYKKENIMTFEQKLKEELL